MGVGVEVLEVVDRAEAEAEDDLAEAVANVLPGDLSRVFFSDDGSTTVEVALKIAYQYWINVGEAGRRSLVAFDGGEYGRACEAYPQVIQAVADAGWELNAHGYDQIPMHKVEDQLGSIKKAVDIVGKFWGRPPRGWTT